MTSGRLTLLLLLLAALAATGWQAWLRPAADIVPLDRDGTPLPDYYLTGLTLQEFAPDGSLARTLKTARLSHVAAQGTDLQQPHLTVDTARGSPWLIEAARGHLDPSGKVLDLPGAVQVTRLATPDNRPLRLETRDLQLRPAEGYAETDQPVTVTSDRDRINAVGLQAWLQDPVRIHFRSRVRGHYEP